MGLERYRLLAQLGAGPDGVAYRGETNDDGAIVVVYDLSRARASPRRWGALVLSLRLAAQLADRTAIRILDEEIAHEQPYLVLEWCGADTLATVAGEGRPGRENDGIALAAALVGALCEAHRLGLAHGRLTPSQVFLCDHGRPKLDFTGAAVGFPAEPPVFGVTGASSRDRDAVDPAGDRAADLYSLGQLLDWLQPTDADRTERESPGAVQDSRSFLRALRRSSEPTIHLSGRQRRKSPTVWWSLRDRWRWRATGAKPSRLVCSVLRTLGPIRPTRSRAKGRTWPAVPIGASCTWAAIGCSRSSAREGKESSTAPRSG